jgi:hypothetical protein
VDTVSLLNGSRNTIQLIYRMAPEIQYSWCTEWLQKYSALDLLSDSRNTIDSIYWMAPETQYSWCTEWLQKYNTVDVLKGSRNAIQLMYWMAPETQYSWCTERLQKYNTVDLLNGSRNTIHLISFRVTHDSPLCLISQHSARYFLIAITIRLMRITKAEFETRSCVMYTSI